MGILSNTCKYAIRAAIYLALNEKEHEKIGIKKIASDLDIPTPFLGKILQNLVRHKIMTSTKGPHGGFGLAKDPHEITLLEIIKVIDGMDLFTECLIGLKSCREYGHDVVPCPIHDQFRPISNQLYELFKDETIGKLKDRIESAEGEIGI
jgi:Rrf2 family protein